MTETEKYNDLRNPKDDSLHESALKFAELVQRICSEENLPFNQGWIVARQRFRQLYEKICQGRQGIQVAAGSLDRKFPAKVNS